VEPQGRKAQLSQADRDVFRGWDYTSEPAFQEEVVDYLRHQAQHEYELDSATDSTPCCSLQ
jgi:hypothetical protein